MMGRKAARNMWSSNTNKIGIQCIRWFYSQGICYDARSYDRKKLTNIYQSIRCNMPEGLNLHPIIRLTCFSLLSSVLLMPFTSDIRWSQSFVSCTTNPASWSSGQSFWLQITRSRVRFPALPWAFSLWGEDPRGDHGLGNQQNQI